MVSINKYLAIAVIASMLLCAAFVRAEEEKEAAPATTTEATQMPNQIPTPDALPGMMGGLGTKIISGLKNAGKAVMSHIPFLNGAAPQLPSQVAPAAEQAAQPVAETGNQEAAPEQAAPAKEQPEEKKE